MNYEEQSNLYARDKKWKKAEEVLLKQRTMTKNVTDLHFIFNNLIDYSYKQRNDDPTAVDRCLQYCDDDIEILPAFKKSWNSEYGTNDFYRLRIPSIDRKIIVYKKRKEYKELVEFLKFLINFYAHTEKSSLYKEQLKKFLDKIDDGSTYMNTDVSISTNKAKNTLSPNINTSNEWFCTLSFKKSTSKDFNQAIQLAKLSPKYYEYNENNNIIYQATYSEEPSEYLDMLILWDLIKNWKSSFVNISGQLVDKKTFNQINRCYGDKCRLNEKNFCYGASTYTENPFGCHRARIHRSGDPWYKFGSVDSTGIFQLHRPELKSELLSRLSTYKHCPALDMNRIISNFNNLPDNINPKKDEDWEYTTYFDTKNDYEYEGIQPTFDPNEAVFTIKLNIEDDLLKSTQFTKEKKKKSIFKNHNLYIGLGILMVLSGNIVPGIIVAAIAAILKAKSNKE